MAAGPSPDRAPAPGGATATPADAAREADEATEAVPDYAHTIVVPIANPDTAKDLIRLASAIVQADGGRVLALSVALGDADAEQSVSKMDEIQGLLDQANGDTDPPRFELLRRTASTVARGILDAVRETGADMVLLGVREPERGRVELGRIVEGVVAAATCDVLLYRGGRALSSLTELDRIVIGVDDSAAARAAARVGIILGTGFARDVHVLTVHDGGRPRYEAYGILDRALRDVPGREQCRTRVVTAVSAAAGLTSEADRDDLVVVGFTGRTEFREWLTGDVARRVFDRASGPVIAVSRRAEARGFRTGAARVVDWLRPALTGVEQETIIWRSNALATASLDYVTLTVVAAILASLGLLLNSGAVIIGAMLVAPLMGPLVAFGIALRAARLQTVRRAVATVLLGSAIAFAVSVAVGLVVPLTVPTTEMLSRGSPSILDAGVALASGLVGAYATARKDIPAALAGVAIAAALVPPICVSGLAVGLGKPELAAGAALLFTVNIVCIAAVGMLVFAWLGLEPTEEATPGQRHIAVLTGLLFPVLLGVLVAVETGRFAYDEPTVDAAVERVLDGYELTGLRVTDDPPVLTVTLRGVQEPSGEQATDLQSALRRDFDVDDLGLQIVFERVVTPD